VFDVARNMGTSVQVIRNYYGPHATPRKLATLVGWVMFQMERTDMRYTRPNMNCLVTYGRE
jgi:hypothetical protein